MSKLLIALILLMPATLFGQQDSTSRTNACDEIREINDKFDKSKTFYAGLTEPISFTKIIKNGVSAYYLSLETHSETLARGKGFIILFKDGTKMSRPLENIEVEVDDDALYKYSVFYRLTTADLAKLKTSGITDFRLYIFDESVYYGKRCKDNLLCLVTKK